MGDPKLTTFLIAMVWISFTAFVFAGFAAQLSANYDTPYDESQLETYNKLSDLNDDIETYEQDTQIEERDLTDIIGGYFSSAYKVLKNTKDSFSIFSSMTDSALDSEVMGQIPATSSFKQSVLLTIIILLVIGVLIRAIIKVSI